jgi:GT2 family glycosyltransferase
VKQWYVADDGSSKEDLELMQQSAPPCAVSWLEKGPEFAGHIGSLNLLLKEVFEQGFDYLLHLEDDWWFIRDEEFISKALSVMEADPSIIQVMINPDYRELDEDWEAKSIHANRRYISTDGVSYALHKYAGPLGSELYQQYLKENNINTLSHVHWPGFTLRPGLWRLSAIRQVGFFDDTTQFEEAYGQRVRRLGFKTAFLTEVSCIHLAPTAPWLAGKDLAPVYKKHQLHLTHQRQSAYDASISVR